MVLYTILGSVKLMEKTKKEPSDLAKSIAVKGGTTEAGIQILQKNKSRLVQTCPDLVRPDQWLSRSS